MAINQNKATFSKLWITAKNLLLPMAIVLILLNAVGQELEVATQVRNHEEAVRVLFCQIQYQKHLNNLDDKFICFTLSYN